MNLKFFCPRWGSENLDWIDFFIKAKSDGYDGIEYAVAGNTPISILDEVFYIASKENMLVIVQHYDTYEADFSKHFDNYAHWLEKLTPYKPLRINSQTGKDFFSFEENASLIRAASAFTKETGVSIYHETHRNKFSFAAHITKEYLLKIPELRITLDASHWVCVAESYLEDQPKAMELAIERTEHIHARVGYIEGPQVADPRVPQWQDALNVHLRWWDKVVERKKLEGPDAILTICPEFGPFPYMVSIPSTQQPIADQYEVNKFMMELLRERYI